MSHVVVFPTRRAMVAWLIVLGALALLLGYVLAPRPTCTIQVPREHPAADILIDQALDGRTDCAVITY